MGEMLSKLNEVLTGYRTHILVVIFIVFCLITGRAPDASDSVLGFDPAALKESILAMAISTFKMGVENVLKK